MSYSSRSQSVVLLTEQATSGALLHAHLLEQGFGVEVLQVGEGEEWLAQLLARRPGAVVLDLQPTWERGWQLFDVLKHSEATQDIPVLLYSLLAEQGQGAVLALDYVAKPMGITALAQALQNLGLAETRVVTEQAILIADDDPEVLALHGDTVRAHFPNCRILTAANGRQALDMLQRGERPLFVLLDLMMPELDGIGVLEAMHASHDATLRAIPVIVLTAQCLSEADMNHLGRGVASILHKGMFTTEETLAQVERALARHKRLGSETQRLVRKVMAYIHTHYAEDISREQMASHAGISARHLTRTFASEAGLTPIDYLNRFRVVQARGLLDEGCTNITEVMGAVGFRDSSYFSRVFRREVGMSPSAYRAHTQTPGQVPPPVRDLPQ
jgi:AraC-like DNA-binding protein